MKTNDNFLFSIIIYRSNMDGLSIRNISITICLSSIPKIKVRRSLDNIVRQTSLSFIRNPNESRRLITPHTKRSCARIVNQIVRLDNGPSIGCCLEPKPLYFWFLHDARVPVFFSVFVRLFKFLANVLRKIA